MFNEESKIAILVQNWVQLAVIHRSRILTNQIEKPLPNGAKQLRLQMRVMQQNAQLDEQKLEEVNRGGKTMR